MSDEHNITSPSNRLLILATNLLRRGQQALILIQREGREEMPMKGLSRKGYGGGGGKGGKRQENES